MSLSVDSLNIKYQDDINTNISRLAIQAKNIACHRYDSRYPHDCTTEV